MPWENYDRQQYVPRREDKGAITQAVQALPGSPPRVVSILAPPGSGKSWFMRRLQDDLCKQHFVIWVDVGKIVLHNGKLDVDRTRAWLRAAIDACRQHCPSLQQIDVNQMQVARAVEVAAEVLCANCNLKKKPIIFVDGYDEFSHDKLWQVEDEILARFLHQNCTMLIVGRRYKLGAQYLRMNEEVIELDVFDGLKQRPGGVRAAQPEIQFNNLRNAMFPKSTCRFRDMADSQRLRHYRWNHPYLNGFLFDLFLAKEQSGQQYTFDAKDLRRCCLALINRPVAEDDRPNRYPAMTQAELGMLLDVVSQLPKTWTAEMFTHQLKRWLPGDAEEYEPLEYLAVCNVIANHQTYKQRYYVRNGLRELLLDIIDMEGINL